VSHLPASDDDPGQLFVGEYPICGRLLSRKGDAISWGLVQNGPTDAPPQECSGGLEGLVGRNECTSLLDRRMVLGDERFQDIIDLVSGHSVG